MPVIIGWREIALRLALTVVAGLVIGFDRGEHGRPAGMRTTLLVCLAASLAMIQANLLMNSVGKARDSFVVLDLMRLPLGILSGMGFIGAGAILRKGTLILGVTTAATLWFTTVMGLCFGGGQLGLGIAAMFLGLGTLWALKYLEQIIRQDTRASLFLALSQHEPSENEIRALIQQSHCTIIAWGILYADHGRRREVRGEIQYRALPGATDPPAFIRQLAEHQHVQTIQWHPQNVVESQIPQSKPQGTPMPISKAE